MTDVFERDIKVIGHRTQVRLLTVQSRMITLYIALLSHFEAGDYLLDAVKCSEAVRDELGERVKEITSRG